jgi:hypothetical protein
MGRDRVHRAQVARRGKRMAQKLTLRYDVVGDILYIDTCPPYAGQEPDELEDEILVRYNPVTDELESVGILFFKKRFPRGALGPGIELPYFARGPKADPPFKVPAPRARRARRSKVNAPPGSPSPARRR